VQKIKNESNKLPFNVLWRCFMTNIKFKGTIHFHDWGPYRKKVENCIFREENGNQEIVIDFKDNTPNEDYYSVKLNKSIENKFNGEILNTKKYKTEIVCRLYKNGDSIAIIGEWLQNGMDYYWNCELKKDT
jgi:hypothetical protein